MSESDAGNQISSIKFNNRCDFIQTHVIHVDAQSGSHAGARATCTSLDGRVSRLQSDTALRFTRFAGTPAARTQTHRARQYTAPTASPAAAIDALQTHDARSGPHPLGRALELRAPPFVDSAPGDIPYPLHTIPSPFRQAINPPSPISPSLRCSRLAARRRPRTCRPSRAASSRAQDPS